MQELVIKAEELTELINYVQDIPTRYGLPVLNFINSTAEKRAKEAEATKADSVATNA
jgi:hypothetical protein